MISSIRVDGSTACMTVDGPTDTDVQTCLDTIDDHFKGGAWASRPTTGLYDGRVYFDTGLLQPFWYDVATLLWYDATGTPHAPPNP